MTRSTCTADENFVYLASDLCASTLHALVERPDFTPYTSDYSVAPNTDSILRDVTTGIDFLHSLGGDGNTLSFMCIRWFEIHLLLSCMVVMVEDPL